jgi:chromate reductase
LDSSESFTPVAKQIVCLPGSLRRLSWNRALLRAAAGTAPGGFELTIYDDLAAVPSFDEDREGLPNPSVDHLRRAVAAADGLLIATPEYNHSFPGVLKNAVDWLSRGRNSALLAKPVAIMGATTGAWGTRLAQAALRQVLTATEAHVLASPTVFVARAAECFDADGRLRDLQVAAALSRFMVAFGEWINHWSRLAEVRERPGV